MPETSTLEVSSKLQRLITYCCNLKDPRSNKSLITIYDKYWLLEILSGEKLKKLEVSFLQYDEGGVDIVDFVKLILEVMEGNVEKKVFLVIAAIDLYKDVAEGHALPQMMKYRNFTDYLINVEDKIILGLYKSKHKR